MVEQSLVFIKPDGVERGLIGTIVARFEARGFRFKQMTLRNLSSDDVDRHYHEHRNQPFYPSLKSFMLRGPVCLMVLEGPGAVDAIRTMVGPTNSLEALPGTIRGDFALSKGENIIHASDSVASAKQEIANFFDLGLS